jgi:hypothetical protein
MPLPADLFTDTTLRGFVKDTQLSPLLSRRSTQIPHHLESMRMMMMITTRILRLQRIQSKF